MSAVQATPYILLGDTRRRALLATIEVCVERWQSTCTVSEPISPSIAVHAAGLRPEIFGRMPSCALRAEKDGRPLLELLASEDTLPALLGIPGRAGGVFGPASQGCGGICTQVQTDVLISLGRSILLAAGLEEIKLEPVTPTLPRPLPAYSAVAVSIGFGRPHACVAALMSSTLLDALSPFSARASAAACAPPMTEAIGEQVIQVEAVLGSAEITLRELADLTPGDVIVLGETLRQPANLAIRNGAPFAQAVLGSANEKRAVCITKPAAGRRTGARHSAGKSVDKG